MKQMMQDEIIKAIASFEELLQSPQLHVSHSPTRMLNHSPFSFECEATQ